MTTGQGIPLEVLVSGANEHDVNFILPLVYLGLPSIGGRPGRPRKYPTIVRADAGYTSADLLEIFRRTGITADIPQRGKPQNPGLGRRRWPIERALAWLGQYRRVGIRREHLAFHYEAFVTLACAMIVSKQLAPFLF